jgi:hypothetical protein
MNDPYILFGKIRTHGEKKIEEKQNNISSYKLYEIGKSQHILIESRTKEERKKII